MIILSLVVLVASFFILLKYIGRYRSIQLLEKVPGPKALPIVGNAHQIYGNLQHMFKMLVKFCEYEGGISRFYLGPRFMVMIYRAYTVEKILSSSQLIDKGFPYHHMHPWVKTGLVTSTGDKWRSRRKLLTPTFHCKILEDYLEVFHKHSQVLVKKLGNLCDEKAHDIGPILTLCTLDIIMEAAMGNSSNFQNDPECEYVKAMSKILDVIHKRHCYPRLQMDLLFKLSGYEKMQEDCLKVLHGTSMAVIRNRREVFSQQEKDKGDTHQPIGVKKRLTFMDLLIKNPEGLSDEDIQEEVDTFMAAGHESTSLGLTFNIFWLAKHPAIQNKVYQEICLVVGESEFISMDHLTDMKYLEACIKESMRLTPPVPLIARELTQDTEIGGYVIPVGTTSIINLFALHRDPEVFPDPFRYDPERFLDLKAIRPSYSFAPFSLGPRNCIGQKFATMEEKVVLANIIRSYKVSTKQHYDDLGLCGTLSLKPENGVHIKLEKRN